MPNLLRLQGLEVCEYICAVASLHLRKTRRLQGLGFKVILEEINLLGNRFSPIDEEMTFSPHRAYAPLQLEARGFKTVIVNLNTLFKGNLLQAGQLGLNP